MEMINQIMQMLQTSANPAPPTQSGPAQQFQQAMNNLEHSAG